jgi:uncharacterized membrane protein YdcZ (DUF606 family)
MEDKAITMSAEQQLRVWSSMQIFWATIFAGIFGGFYLLSENYKALGYPQLAKKTFFAGLICSCILFTTFFFIPEASLLHFAPFLIMAQCIIAMAYIRGEHVKSFYNHFSKYHLIYLPVIILIILALPFYLSETLTEKIPSFIIPMIPALCTQSLAQINQDKYVKILMEKGNKKGSLGRFFGIISLSLLFQLSIVFIFVFLAYLGFPGES